MRKLLILLLLLIPINAHALRVSRPDTFSEPLDKKQINQLNSYLEDIWNITNGRYDTLGNGKPGTDYTFTIDGESNDGTITYYEDENEFLFSGYVRSMDVWHVFGGFQGESETISIAAVDTWTFITNATNDLWQGTEADGFTLSGDVMTVSNTGDYTGSLSITFSALNGKDFEFRVYNITQARVEGYHIGATTTGATNYTNISIPLYIEATAGDQLRMEVQCTTDGSDPTLTHAIFYIAYLHD